MCFHRLGHLHDRTAVLQQYRASGLAPITAAIVSWNTVYLGRALDALRRRGEAIPDAPLAHAARLGWQHINPSRGDPSPEEGLDRRRPIQRGDHIRGADAALGPDGFRPLRGTPTRPFAA